MKTRWDKNSKKYVKNEDVDIFMNEILAVCRKHGLSISHEDTEGGFVITNYSEQTAQWLDDASVKLVGE